MAMHAADLKRLLDTEVFDTVRAATYLGVQPNSVEVAALRHRIPFVPVNRTKLFTRADLDEYKERRGPGRSSRLTTSRPFAIKRK